MLTTTDKLSDEIITLARDYATSDDFSNSDMQGCAEAIALKYLGKQNSKKYTEDELRCFGESELIELILKLQ